MENYRILSIMPAPDWHVLYVHYKRGAGYEVDDPPYSTEPLVGWAVCDQWYSTRPQIIPDEDAEVERTVQPLVLCDDYVDILDKQHNLSYVCMVHAIMSN